MSSRGILPWVTSASSVEYEILCSPPLASSPERTSISPSDAATEWTDRAPGLALDLAGNVLQDSLPLPDLELDPDELNKLDQLPFDLRPDAELSLEEEELDCDCCGEGDFARLHFDGERAVDGELGGGGSCNGSVSASLET